MTELEQLKAEKKRIEDRIKELSRLENVTVGDVRFFAEKIAKNGGIRWTVAVRREYYNYQGNRDARWTPIVSEKSREAAVKTFSAILCDMTKVYRKLNNRDFIITTGGGDDEESTNNAPENED